MLVNYKNKPAILLKKWSSGCKIDVYLYKLLINNKIIMINGHEYDKECDWSVYFEDEKTEDQLVLLNGWKEKVYDIKLPK